MNCYKCKGSGWIVGIHKENRGAYTFLCNNCTAGNNKSKNITTWNDSFSKQYEVEFVATTAIQAPKPIIIPKQDHAMKAANDNTFEPEEKTIPDFDAEDLPW